MSQTTMNMPRRAVEHTGLAGVLFQSSPPVLRFAALLAVMTLLAACGDSSTEHSTDERRAAALAAAEEEARESAEQEEQNRVLRERLDRQSLLPPTLRDAPRQEPFRLALREYRSPDVALQIEDERREDFLAGTSLLEPGATVVGPSRDEEGNVVAMLGDFEDGQSWADVGGQPWEYGYFHEYEDTPPGWAFLDDFGGEAGSAHASWSHMDWVANVRADGDGVEWTVRVGDETIGTMRYGMSMDVNLQLAGDKPARTLAPHTERAAWNRNTASLLAREWEIAEDHYLIDSHTMHYEHHLKQPLNQQFDTYVIGETLELSAGLALRINGQPLGVGERADTASTIAVVDEASGDPTLMRMEIDRPVAWDSAGATTEAEQRVRDEVAAIYYRVERLSEESYRFETRLSAEWLRSKERVYPVVIDPSTTLTAGDGGTHGYWHEPFNQYWNWSHTQYYLTAGQLNQSTLPSGSVIVGTSWFNRTNANYRNFRGFTRDKAYFWIRDGVGNNGFDTGTNTFTPDNVAFPPAIYQWDDGRSGHYENFGQSGGFTPPDDSCVQHCGELRPQGSCSCREDCAADPNWDCCDDVGICGSGQDSCFGRCGPRMPSGCSCDFSDCIPDEIFDPGQHSAGDRCCTSGCSETGCGCDPDTCDDEPGGCCSDIAVCLVGEVPDVEFVEPDPGPWNCIENCGEQPRTQITQPVPDYSQCNSTTPLEVASWNGFNCGTGTGGTHSAASFASSHSHWYNISGSYTVPSVFNNAGTTFSGGWVGYNPSSNCFSHMTSYDTPVVPQDPPSQFTDCCTSHGTIGCDDSACTNAVCNADSFCCATDQYGNPTGSWDNECASLAQAICAVCDTRTCCSENNSVGCHNASCTNTVCSIDPWCCDADQYGNPIGRWDSVCATIAEDNCAFCQTGGEAGQLCTQSPPPTMDEVVQECSCDAGCSGRGDCCTGFEPTGGSVHPTQDGGQHQTLACNPADGYTCEGNCGVDFGECTCEAACDAIDDMECCDNKQLYCGSSTVPSGTCLGFCGGQAVGCSCSSDCVPGGTGSNRCCEDIDFYCTDLDTCIGRCGQETLSGNYSCEPDCGQPGFGPCADDACLRCGYDCPGDDGSNVFEVRGNWFGALSGGSASAAGAPLEHANGGGQILLDEVSDGSRDYFHRNGNSLMLTSGQCSGCSPNPIPTTQGTVRPEFQFVFCPAGGSSHCEIYRFANTPTTQGFAWPSHPRTRITYHRPTTVPLNDQVIAAVPPGRHQLRMHEFTYQTTGAWADACTRELVVSSPNPNHCDRLRTRVYREASGGSFTQVAQLNGCTTRNVDLFASAGETLYVRVDTPDRDFTGQTRYSIGIELDDGSIQPPTVSASSVSTSELQWQWALSDPGGSLSFQYTEGDHGAHDGIWNSVSSQTGVSSPESVSSLDDNTCYTARVRQVPSCGDPVAASAAAATRIRDPEAEDFSVELISGEDQLVFDSSRINGLNGSNDGCGNFPTNETAIEVELIDDGTLTSLPTSDGVSFELPSEVAGCFEMRVRYINRTGVPNAGGWQTFEVQGDLDDVPWVFGGLSGLDTIYWQWPRVACAVEYDFGNNASVDLASVPGNADPVVYEQDELAMNTCYEGYVRAVGPDTPGQVTSSTTGSPAFNPVSTGVPAPVAPTEPNDPNASYQVTLMPELDSVLVEFTDIPPNFGVTQACATPTNDTAIQYQLEPCERVRYSEQVGLVPEPQGTTGWETASGVSFNVSTQQHHCWRIRTRFVNMDGVPGEPSDWADGRVFDLSPPEDVAVTDAELSSLTWQFTDASHSEDYWRGRVRICTTYGTCEQDGVTPNPSAWSNFTDFFVFTDDVGGVGDSHDYSFDVGTGGAAFYGNVAYQAAFQSVLRHSIGTPDVEEISGDWSDTATGFTRATAPEICGVRGGDAGHCTNWQNSRDLFATGLDCDPYPPEGQPWQECALSLRIGRLGLFDAGAGDENVSNNACTLQAGASLVRQQVDVDGSGNVTGVAGPEIPLVINECLDPANAAACAENQCGSQNSGGFPGRYGFAASGPQYWEGRYEAQVTDEGLEHGETYRYTMRYYNSDGLPSDETSFLFTVGCTFGDHGVCLDGIQNTRPLDDDVDVLDINSASASALTALPGIGPSLAQSIVEYRDANGPFAIPEDLVNVSGIGPATFNGLCDRIEASGVTPTTQNCGQTIVSSGPDACVYPGYDGFERCDGVDWSCSGDPVTELGESDPISEVCYEGPAGTVGVGICEAGERFCVEVPAGSGDYEYDGPCVGQQLPEEEVCDMDDNSCSGDPFDVDYGDDLCGGYVSVYTEGSNTVSETEHTSIVYSEVGGRLETPDSPGTFVCVNGFPICDASGAGCADIFINACGGCDELVDPDTDEPVSIGSPCGECPDQTWECDGAGQATCADSAEEGDDCTLDGELGICGEGVIVCGSSGFTCEPISGPQDPADFCDFEDLDCDGDPFNDARQASIDVTGFASGGVGDIPGFRSSLDDPNLVTFDFEADCDMQALGTDDESCAALRFEIASTGNDTIPADALVSLEQMGVQRPSNGLVGEYFVGADFEEFVLERIDPVIDFDWGNGSPDPELPDDFFSVRWRGYITAPATGEYTFHARTDDGVRLVIGGIPVITQWEDQSANTVTGSIELQAGQPVPFAMFYYEAEGQASARLRWSGPGIAGQQLVPSSAFTPYENRMISQRAPLGREVPPALSDEFTFCWQQKESFPGASVRVVIEDAQSEQNDGLACIGPWRPDSLDGSEPRTGSNLVLCGPEQCDGYDNNQSGEIDDFPEACGDVSLSCLEVPSMQCGEFNNYQCQHADMNCNPDRGFCFVCAGDVVDEKQDCVHAGCPDGEYCDEATGICFATSSNGAMQLDTAPQGTEFSDLPASALADDGPRRGGAELDFDEDGGGSFCATAGGGTVPVALALLILAVPILRRRRDEDAS